MAKEIDRRHGGPYDRGSADAYYRRPSNPHYYKGATYSTPIVELAEMTKAEISAYNKGFKDQTASGDFKY